MSYSKSRGCTATAAIEETRIVVDGGEILVATFPSGHRVLAVQTSTSTQLVALTERDAQIVAEALHGRLQ